MYPQCTLLCLLQINHEQTEICHFADEIIHLFSLQVLLHYLSPAISESPDWPRTEGNKKAGVEWTTNTYSLSLTSLKIVITWHIESVCQGEESRSLAFLFFTIGLEMGLSLFISLGMYTVFMQSRKVRNWWSSAPLRCLFGKMWTDS